MAFLFLFLLIGFYGGADTGDNPVLVAEKSRSTIINTNQFVEGIYLLNVFEKDKKVFTDKLVIIH